jgi:hypothetical protein
VEAVRTFFEANCFLTTILSGALIRPSGPHRGRSSSITNVMGRVHLRHVVMHTVVKDRCGHGDFSGVT